MSDAFRDILSSKVARWVRERRALSLLFGICLLYSATTHEVIRTVSRIICGRTSKCKIIAGVASLFRAMPAYTVTIDGDGKVTYVGRSNVISTGKRERRISQEQLRTLLTRFDKLTSTHLLTFTIMSAFLVVAPLCYQLRRLAETRQSAHNTADSSVPESLWRLASKVDEVAGVRKCVGK